MKFLLDENVPNFFKNSLLEAGYKDIKRINDFGKGLKDEDVFQISLNEERTIVTIDTDFHEYKKAENQGIISISGKLKYPDKLLITVLKQIERDERFKFDTFKNVFIRITHQNFKITHKKKNKYKEVVCKYKNIKKVFEDETGSHTPS